MSLQSPSSGHAPRKSFGSALCQGNRDLGNVEVTENAPSVYGTRKVPRNVHWATIGTLGHLHRERRGR